MNFDQRERKKKWKKKWKKRKTHNKTRRATYNTHTYTQQDLTSGIKK